MMVLYPEFCLSSESFRPSSWKLLKLVWFPVSLVLLDLSKLLVNVLSLYFHEFYIYNVYGLLKIALCPLFD